MNSSKEMNKKKQSEEELTEIFEDAFIMLKIAPVENANFYMLHACFSQTLRFWNDKSEHLQMNK